MLHLWPAPDQRIQHRLGTDRIAELGGVSFTASSRPSVLTTSGGVRSLVAPNCLQRRIDMREAFWLG